MDDLHGGIGGVHALAALPGRPADIDFDFIGFDFHVHFLGFRQHGDGRGAGVDAALRLGRGHALDTMHAALVFEPFENVGAGHFKNDFLEATEIGRIGIERLNLPLVRLSVTTIHAKQIGGKQRGFRTAGASADFHDRVA